MILHATSFFIPAAKRWHLRKVRQALGNPAVTSHNTETLATALNMSPRSLHRQLQEEGASLQQLKEQVRLERAEDLLLRITKPVKQMAASSGFRNEKGFMRAFQDWVGMSPAAFRSMAQRLRTLQTGVGPKS